MSETVSDRAVLEFVETKLDHEPAQFCRAFCKKFTTPSLEIIKLVLNRLSQKERFATLISFHRTVRPKFPGEQAILDIISEEFLVHGFIKRLEKKFDKLLWHPTDLETLTIQQIIESLLPHIHSLVQAPLFKQVFSNFCATADSITKELCSMIENGDHTAERVARVLQKIQGLGSSQYKDILPTLKILLYQVAEYSSSYRVHALFYDDNAKVGRVREIGVRFEKHLGEGNGDISFSRLEKGLWQSKVEWDASFENSVRNAYHAALGYLCTQHLNMDIQEYDVFPEILTPGEGSESLKLTGGSLGLAVSLAIIARVTDQEIGVGKPGNLAVTGAICDGRGTISGVKHVPEKIEAIKTLKGVLVPDIEYVFVPQANASEAQKAGANVTVKPFSDLQTLIASEILFDPWKSYLETLSEARGPADGCETDPQLQEMCEKLGERWNEIESSATSRVVLFGKHYYSEQAHVLQHIARRMAQRRLDSRSNRSTIPVPVVLNLDMPACGLFDFVQREIREVVTDAQILRQLRAGRMLLLLHGQSLPRHFFAPGRGIHEIEQLFPQNKIIFVCPESVWNSVKSIPKRDRYCCLYLGETRSTFLDRQIKRMLSQRIRSSILALQVSNQRLEAYFCGGRPGSYMEPQLVELDSHSHRPERTSLSALIEKVLESEGAALKNLLIIGQPGDGKSTALLKAYWELLQANGPTPEKRYVPLYAECHALREQRSLFQFLTEFIPDLHGEEELKSALAHTPRLIIFLDGLDEHDLPNDDHDLLVNYLDEFSRYLDSLQPRPPLVMTYAEGGPPGGDDLLVKLRSRLTPLRLFRFHPLAANDLEVFWGKCRYEALKEQMARFGDITPYMAFIMTQVQGTGWETQSELLAEFLDTWITKRAARGKMRVKGCALPTNEVRRLLQLVAMQMTEAGRNTVSSEELEGLLKGYMAQKLTPRKAIRLLERTGFLLSSGGT